MMIIHHLITLALLAFALVPVLHAEKPSMVSRPRSIVLIYADDLGYGDLGCYGAKKISTPQIDAIAAGGIRFTDAHTSTACCSPSRYAILTGRYPWRTSLKKGVLGPQAPLLIEPGRETLASFLKTQGYTTGIVGKWHLGLGNPPETEWNKEPIGPGPNEVGFDYSFIISGSPNFPPFAYLENGRVAGRKPGESIELVLPKKGHPAGWKMSEKTTITGERRKGSQMGKVLTAKAVEFIKANADKPFFLYFPTPQVHLPITPNEKFKGTSKAGKYGDYVQELDSMVGEILAALDCLGLARDSLVIFSTDNGADEGPAAKTGHKPNGPILRGEKSLIYEGGHRVPFIVRWPQVVPGGGVSSVPISQLDLSASLHALFGKRILSGAAPDSLNVLPALLGEVDTIPARTMIHHSTAGVFAIREGDWKLIEGIPYAPGVSPREPEYELYNLREDLAETKNLAAKNPDFVRKLQGKLDSIRNAETSNTQK